MVVAVEKSVILHLVQSRVILDHQARCLIVPNRVVNGNPLGNRKNINYNDHDEMFEKIDI